MRSIIITGGELFNKGAQAMTFVAVHELRRRYPNHKIYLLSEQDMERPAAEKECFQFSFTGWYPVKFAHCQTNALLRTVCLVRNHAELKAAEDLYRSCDAMVDISGYALGSNWSDANCHRYLDHLEFAQAFNIPVYLMPQSFGPFDFGASRSALNDRIKKLLPTAKVIFAREQEGYDALVNTYGLTNVRLAPDLVLSNKEISLDRVFKKQPVIKVPEIQENSVAVIPNEMNANVCNREAVVAMYGKVIDQLLALGKVVYLINHSVMDVALCRVLKENFKNRDDVILLDQDFSCLEFNDMVQKFQFVVASRFHAIVHAYKNGVPCIALGWATKYDNLLGLLGQRQYIFDLRNGVDTSEMCAAIKRLSTCFPEESKAIRGKLVDIQGENVFDVLPNR